MKKIILIHAHKNTGQLNTLISQFNDKDFEVYVNLDLNAAIAANGVSRRARLVEPRIGIRWGDFSQVQATLNSLRQICREQGEFGHLVFLSGTDFPVASNRHIHRFLDSSPDSEYMTWQEIGSNDWDCACRFEALHYTGSSIIKRLLFSCINRVRRLQDLKRKMPLGMKPYGGSSWWMLSRSSIMYILSFVDRHPEYMRFMKHTICSDEFFFQTILLNSVYAEKVVNNIYRYIDWSDCSSGLTSSPNELKPEDYERILRSGALFCRKITFPQGRELAVALARNREEALPEMGADTGVRTKYKEAG